MKNFILISLSVLFLQTSISFGAETAIKEGPVFSQDQILLLWKDGQKSVATKKISQWKEADKKSPEPWITQARIAFEQKKYKRCLTLGEKALDRSSQSAAAYYWRGRAYEALNNNLDGANEYRAALFANPDFSEAKEALARINTQLAVDAKQ